jgi:hypothetical protein
LIAAGNSGGLIKEIPSLSYFNHLILVADTKDGLIWMDPTSETSAFGELPFSDQNRDCLIIAEDRSYFLKTPKSAPEVNIRRINAKLKVKDDLSAYAEAEIYVSGEFNAKLRVALKYRDAKEREEFLRELLSIPNQGRIDEVQIENLEMLDKDLKVKVKYSIDRYLTLNQNQIGASGTSGAFYLLKLPTTPNPYVDLFTQDSRYHRVVVGGGITFEDEVQVSLPDRFSFQITSELSELEDNSFSSEIGSVTVKYKALPNGLSVQRRLIIKDSEIPKERFSDLKRLMNIAMSQGEDFVRISIR